MRRSRLLSYFFLAGLTSVTLDAVEAQSIVSDGGLFQAQYNGVFPYSGETSGFYNMQIYAYFYPNYGVNPSFDQVSSFWDNPSPTQPYYATATQGGNSIKLYYQNAPADPYLFTNTIPFNASLLGSWNINQIGNCYPSNSGNCNTSYSVNVTTNDIKGIQPLLANLPSQPPVESLAVTNLTTTPTVSWSIPSSLSALTSQGFTIGTQFLIFDHTENNKYIDFDDFYDPANPPVTSLNLASLPSNSSGNGMPLTIPMVVGHTYILSAVTELHDPSGTDVFQSRGYTVFTPSASEPAFSGLIYLPSQVTGNSEDPTYAFNMSVKAGQTYNLDPAMAEGFIFRTGAGDPDFTSVELPDIGNHGDYALYLWEGGKWVFDMDVAADQLFPFIGGVSEFEILGIDPPVDASTGTAFETQVTFGGDGTFTGTMTAVVPELSTWAMSLLGFAGLGYAGYRASRKSAALAA
jgi:hypothetical protein